MNENLNDWLDALIDAARTIAAAIGVGAIVTLLVLSLLGHSRAGAQLLMPDGRLNTACASTPRVPPLPLPPPWSVQGLPKQLGGTCTEFVATADGKGGALAYWCPQITPEKARIRLFAVQWDKVTLPMVLDFAQLGLPGIDKEQLIQSMVVKYQSLSVLDMCDIWHPLVDRLNAIYPAPLPLPPAPGTWKTIGGTVFVITSGRLSNITSKRVAAGIVCDERATAMSVTRVFKTYTGGAINEGAECKQ